MRRRVTIGLIGGLALAVLLAGFAVPAVARGGPPAPDRECAAPRRAVRGGRSPPARPRAAARACRPRRRPTASRRRASVLDALARAPRPERYLRPPSGTTVGRLALAPDGRLVVGGLSDGSTAVWERETGSDSRLAGRAPSTASGRRSRSARAGLLVATGHQDGAVVVRRLADGAVVASWTDHEGGSRPSRSRARTPWSRRRVISPSSWRSTARAPSCGGGTGGRGGGVTGSEPGRPAPGHGERRRGAAVEPARRCTRGAGPGRPHQPVPTVAAIGAGVGSRRQQADGRHRPIAAVRQHDRPAEHPSSRRSRRTVSALAAGGTSIVTADGERVLLQAGGPTSEPTPLLGHTADVVDVATTADGSTVVSTDGDNVIVWHGGRGSPLATACRATQGRSGRWRSVPTGRRSPRRPRTARPPVGRGDRSGPGCARSRVGAVTQRLALRARHRHAGRWDRRRRPGALGHGDGIGGAPGGTPPTKAPSSASLCPRTVRRSPVRTAPAWSRSGTLTLEPPGFGDDRRPVAALAVSPDGRTAATAGADGLVRRWEVGSGEAIGDGLAGHTGLVGSLAFSPDGKLLASGGDDRTVRLWDAGSGRAVGVLAGHTDLVLGLAFLGDHRLASGGEDGTVRLWDVDRRVALGSALLSSSAEFVNDLAAGPSGGLLAAAQGSGRRAVERRRGRLAVPGLPAGGSPLHRAGAGPVPGRRGAQGRLRQLIARGSRSVEVEDPIGS